MTEDTTRQVTEGRIRTAHGHRQRRPPNQSWSRDEYLCNVRTMLPVALSGDNLGVQSVTRGREGPGGGRHQLDECGRLRLCFVPVALSPSGCPPAAALSSGQERGRWRQRFCFGSCFSGVPPLGPLPASSDSQGARKWAWDRGWTQGPEASLGLPRSGLYRVSGSGPSPRGLRPLPHSRERGSRLHAPRGLPSPRAAPHAPSSPRGRERLSLGQGRGSCRSSCPGGLCPFGVESPAALQRSSALAERRVLSVVGCPRGGRLRSQLLRSPRPVPGFRQGASVGEATHSPGRALTARPDPCSPARLSGRRGPPAPWDGHRDPGSSIGWPCGTLVS
ncbi:uncharacterized protein LOC119868969 [Canis lupus familiaris]|uniref:uncharacterized protein LOC119868969 n=1 Tax=Canis lupus familiaris TaxID=9615 RepID=UPI0018F6288A|nr:uncharacterized protein LOC119868969 [Canis lupus familiaris]